ncbi:MAG: aspartate--tRNA(Asn) ligase [Nitrososphaerota archaeon]|nr:aspartate--tRNA(Asn) ligase [Candidatus Calditenuaceae archaeon]MDW8073790.1 aspartate--tRNA(Asn) ligase [Nitrososphaerota archaeon]
MVDGEKPAAASKEVRPGSVKPELDGQRVAIRGWVHEVRDLGSLVFVVLRDRSGLCQAVFSRKGADANLQAALDGLTRESAVRVWGVVKVAPQSRMGVEVRGDGLEVLARAVERLPYEVTGKVPASMTTRLDHRILDLRKPANTAIFLIADTLFDAIREYLRGEGFVEVRTPKIIATATEGGAALFKVDYFGREAYLAQSPQLYKEELVTVFDRVFEIGPFFRAEASHTRRHVSEFTSVDIEAAFMNYEDVMRVLEGMVVHVFKRVLDERRRELELLGVSLRPPRTPFKRITYDEALRELEELGYEKSWGGDLETPDLRYLAKRHTGFYFITHFPTAIKPFYIQPDPSNPSVSESFDLMYQWLELASGGTRISDPSLLRQRLTEQGLNPESFKHHVAVYDYGMPVHAGWGLGFERLLMVITRITNIREVILFPRDRFRLTP